MLLFLTVKRHIFKVRWARHWSNSSPDNMFWCRQLLIHLRLQSGAASLFDFRAACCPLRASLPTGSMPVSLPVTFLVPQSLSLQTEACLSWERLTLHRHYRRLSQSRTAQGHPKALPQSLHSSDYSHAEILYIWPLKVQGITASIFQG